METEIRKIQDLVPYDKNPRKNDDAVKQVSESIKKHGQVKALVVSKAGHPFKYETIAAGHTTARALEALGFENAFVVVKEFKDEAEFVDFNIRDNKTSEFAFWDTEKLEGLDEEFNIDLEAMGFDLDMDWESDIEKLEKIIDEDCEAQEKIVIMVPRSLYDENLAKIADFCKDLPVKIK